MDKILIALKVPSVDECFDIRIPTFLPLSQVVPLVIDLVQACTPYNFVSSETPLLCCRDRELLLSDQSRSLSDYGIENGDTLYLF